jgi:cytochrome c551
LNQVLAQSASSGAFTLMDIFLTDAANSLLDQQQAPPPRDRADDDGDDGGDDGDGDGAASPGEAAYVAQNCGACHGAAGEGGSAPALAGMDQLAALDERFAGGANHLGTTLTDQEILDVADWLLGDDAAGNGGDGGDQLVAGADAYAAGNCAACHGADAEGGSGPAMAGMDELAALEERFGGGANHLGTTLTDQEIEDVAAWLASL